MLNVWKLAVRVAARFLVSKKPRYSAAWLTPASHLELLRWWAKNVGPTLDNEIAEHMTIAFMPTEDEIAEILVGRHVKLHVVGYAQDERGQAVLIGGSGVGVKLKNRHPHITVAVADGTQALYSNELLARGPIHPVNGPTLDATLDFEE
jgi:hypothetical protein